MLESSAYPLSIGELVGGKYRIDTVIGEGGMGVVFAATHVDLHCPVALKVIRQELSQQPELIARLMLEARAAAQIKSEHVCRVLDVSRLDGGPPYVVMEYLEGKNLGVLLEAKGQLSERVAVDYVLQACEAVAEAHRAGVIHRDLKPENLFLAEFPDGRQAIKVLDFGISKLTGSVMKVHGSSSLTNPSSAMGSPHFMAPEQMTAARDVDARADIWALGTILHQLVTGHLAFDGDSLPAVCAAVLQAEPVPVRDYLPELSAGLEEAIRRCLVKDRSQRLNSVADLAQLIAPFGSPQAAQSATRIARLLDNFPSVPSSADKSSGTLVSPRQLPTPRTPVQRIPIETASAVTSSKRSFASLGSTIKRTRVRWYAVMGCVLVLGVAAALVRSWSPSQPTAFTAANPSLISTSPGAAAHAIPPTVPDVAGSSPTVNELQPLALASALAPSTQLAPEASALRGQTSTVPRAPSRPLTVTTTVRGPNAKNKTNSAVNPYNSDNFGGRR